MYSCRQASRIVSESLDRKLTMQEQINLRMHLFICSMCRNFKQNIYMLEQMMRRLGLDDVMPETLSGKDRETILAGLGKRLQAAEK